MTCTPLNPFRNLGKKRAVAARENVDLVTHGGEPARELSHVDVLSTAVDAAKHPSGEACSLIIAIFCSYGFLESRHFGANARAPGNQREGIIPIAREADDVEAFVGGPPRSLAEPARLLGITQQVFIARPVSLGWYRHSPIPRSQ